MTAINAIDFTAVEALKHSPMQNYGIPGLKSWLITDPSDKGCIRLFEMTREHVEPMVPHSHRFDFSCVVLAGKVVNRLWMPQCGDDTYMLSEIHYKGDPGAYGVVQKGKRTFSFTDTEYKMGAWYSMRYNQIHSIYFSRGTKVLFFEGAKQADMSMVIEPVVDGEVIPLFKTETWMFKKS